MNLHFLQTRNMGQTSNFVCRKPPEPKTDGCKSMQPNLHLPPSQDKDGLEGSEDEDRCRGVQEHIRVPARTLHYVSERPDDAPGWHRGEKNLEVLG